MTWLDCVTCLVNKQFTFPLFSGSVYKELEKANEKDKKHDCERHGDHLGVLLLVSDAGPSPCGIQCGSGILPNLLQHFHGRQSGRGGQDHKGYYM